MAKLLTEQFGFDPANVRQLADWPKDLKARPTYANIVAGMEDLIQKAGPGTQIVIQFSGHGTQFPIPDSQEDPNDPRNPEPDGFDEVFLPSDVEGWTPNSHKNAIIDDQIGVWLDQLRDKGANVWIIFDCCHSGTMTRDVKQDVEHQRAVRPQVLGVSDKAIRKAREKAAKAAERTRGTTQEPSALGLKPGSGKGSLVAFYATQSFEEAPELPRPAGAAQVQDNYYGMLTYTLAEALRQRQSALTYRELAQLIASRYRAERKSRPPTPFAEGDLDREVLGVNVWPKPTDLQLERDEDKLKVDAGQLRGLTPGSILEVHPPGQGAKEVLGYVKVNAVTPLGADVEPCEYDGKEKVGADKLPDGARCRVAQQAFGDMRVVLAVGRPKEAARGNLADQLNKALDQLDDSVKSLVVTTPDEGKADFVLETADVGGKPKVVLWQGQGRKLLDPKDEKLEAESSRVAGQPVPRRAFGGYAPDDAKELAGQLDRDLQKIYKWQNVWRIAGTLNGTAEGNDNYGLKLAVEKLDSNKQDAGPLRETFVDPGQHIEIRLTNDGGEDLWVTMLYLDANFGIQKLEVSGAIQKRTGRAMKATINEKSIGTEGLVVFAVPLSVSKSEPNFDFLKQEPLMKADGAKAKEVPKTPFGQLLAAAAFGNGARGLEPDAPTNPAVLSMSWVTRPPQAAKPAKP
jgi:hypothetical protein